ncbi:DUF368 domain-containing protein [Tetragenococcus halophilus]|uniref:DUF368 domain-containing protein n=1 Tax=Tetragenococcus halophilus TaxID=51669 RepID=UPI000CCA9649|nr:DUF368 domain-containing protein [Tetragenococcus halophilus]MCO8286272.1 DUF368 domain-containing protein [Tetragenococcus halophilus]NWN99347.1 DUF368 domain-containing protein [Tetragenococcus halophilus]WJS81076.1 DUF368 domain-containing protein [Tetragenococcus halophilus]GBD73244.1 putative uncharacterized protein [Tetragenococcus halophilus subsp. halophilus]GBD75478.1 putative uncharacterized protein [Tetragenococcus halophilus subsp. halophilus]
MKNIWLIIKGIFMGVANIVPGLSGGTIAVSLGIYDDIIRSIATIKSEMKKSLRFFIPLLIGLLLGVALFSRMITYLFDFYPLVTAATFTGLILGGFPILWKEFRSSLYLQKKKINYSHWMIFLAMFVLVAWMGVAEVSGTSTHELSLEFPTLFGLFFIGIIASASMVIPGISGSLVMLILGWYQAFLAMINGFIDALRAVDINEILTFGIYCSFFGIGMLFGIAIISKLIDQMFRHFPSYTYAGIFGLVLASPIAIFSSLTLEASSFSIFTVVMSVLLAIVGFGLTYLLGNKSS